MNCDGVAAGHLKLTGIVLAEIYLGKIKSWSDPAIAQINPGVTLPDIEIVSVHRADGSGSTLTWTHYLSAASAEWKAGPGSDTLIEWPAGTGAEGTSGMLAPSPAKGAIGYVEFGQAQRPVWLSPARQPRGAFIDAKPGDLRATAAAATWEATNGFYLQLTDTAGGDAYPLPAATFVLMHKANARRHAPGARCSSWPTRWSAAGPTRPRSAMCRCRRRWSRSQALLA